ncbi:MAG: PqqD family protein [Desulfosporosinus sp.]|nr:PqqD family protein [Desulfosporosinus sp.]
MGNMPVKTNGIFTRNESNGNMVIFSPVIGVKFFNKTAAQIYSNINGKNTHNDIIQIINDKYGNVDKITIKKDVLETLYALRTLRMIKWQPEENDVQMECCIENQNGIKVAGEMDYGNISRFILEKMKLKNTQEEISLIPMEDTEDYYRDFLIRTRQFFLAEVNFIFEEKGQITSLISIIGLNENISSVNIGLVLGNPKNINDLRLTYLHIENYLRKMNKSKIKVNIFEDKITKNIIDLFIEIGFEKEARLERELNDRNVLIYKKFIIEGAQLS